jgi:tRNA dimethylallyltransferase
VPQKSNLPKIIVICGPTGVGKTHFAIEVAERFGAEIVGADSMQIYRDMDIGTAKPTVAEQAAVRHHMVDIIDPEQPYDAAAYGRQAHAVVQELIRKGVLPLVVGGTGLYIKALIYGLFQTHRTDPAIRQNLLSQAAQEGNTVLYAWLIEKDPRTAARIHPNDTYRIVRALEVMIATGQPLSHHHQRHGFEQPRYNVLTLGLRLPRRQLYDRIDRRVDEMIAEGLKDEVARLIASGRSIDLKSMQSLGYHHMVKFLQGRLSWEETVRTLKRDHRRYAKRQLTWFTALDQIRWLAPDQTREGCRLVASHLKD